MATLIISVVLVEFHHRFGPRVEYAYPPLPEVQKCKQTSSEVALPEEWSAFPFICLPDGIHQKTKELIYFQLPPVSEWRERGALGFMGTVFGVALFQQMPAENLIVRPKDVTRNNIQKSLIVLSSQPLLGHVREKLVAVTQAMFDQRDFSNKSILETLYADLARSCASVALPSLYNSLLLVKFAQTCKLETVLIAVKALLLQKRILFFGQELEQLTAFQYCLVSLVPDLMRHLQPSSSVELTHELLPRPTDDPTNGLVTGSPQDAQQLDIRCMPLRLFSKKSVFFPYMPLQYLNFFENADAYLAGTSNKMIITHSSTKYDLLLDLDTGTTTFGTNLQRNLLSLTASDKRFIQALASDSGLRVYGGLPFMEASETPSLQADTSMNTFTSPTTYKGSDDDIRQRFHGYFYAILNQAYMYFQDSLLTPAQRLELHSSSLGRIVELAGDFNLSFIKHFVDTLAFREWYFDVREGQWPLELLALPECHPGHLRSSFSAISHKFSDRLQELSNLVVLPTSNLINKTSAKLRQRESSDYADAKTVSQTSAAKE